MGKKKNKQVNSPANTSIETDFLAGHPSVVLVLWTGVWRWERYALSSKESFQRANAIRAVLMQHQKAKHFKCNMCPRRLNTAGGLAVHIQQVHKLEPEKCVLIFFGIRTANQFPLSLPRIENALPGRDGYEIEIFGMEGIPAPDVADYKRRKEIELGLTAGSISQPQAKRPKVENRPLTDEELKAQLEAHKALMGASDPASAPAAIDSSVGAVYGAPPRAYVSPPIVAPIPPPAVPGLVPSLPPFLPRFPGQPPIPPFPPGVGIPPGWVGSSAYLVNVIILGYV
jgi:hypothetical protein